MGICYGTPVDDGPSKPTSPAACEEKRKRENNYNKPNGLERKASGDKLKEEKKDTVVAAKGQGDNKVSENIPSSGKIVTPNLKVFTLAELRAATKNFRPDTKLGEGGFGQVFKGWVDKTTYAPSRTGVGMAVAVKKSNPDSLQGLQEWQAEVKFLGKFSHPNLVKLLGYCWEEGQYLLVYEYMQKGSLESHLFRKGAEPLPWDIRLKIAIDAAKGLTFLHCSEKSVIYRDFKASNILLDGDYNAKLSDFGLAKLGPIDGNSHLTTSVMGTYGYAAPEYVATGHLYVKSDVYGFGVVLLEMLTGLRALDTNRPFGQHNLVDYAKPSLSNKRKLKKLMDPRLEGQYPFNAASKAAELILTCLESDPKNRPSMEEVLETLETISAVEKETPTNKVKHKAATNHHFKKRPEQSCSNQHNKRSYDHHHHRVPPRSTHDDCGISARPYNY